MRMAKSSLGELTTFCNNLGKAFRKFTEDNEKRFSLLEKEVRTLKQKNVKIEKDITDWDTEDLEERMLSNEREFATFKESVGNKIEEIISGNEKELKSLKENTDESMYVKESQISKYFEQELEILKDSRDEDINNIKKEREKLESELREIEVKMNRLEAEVVKLTTHSQMKREKTMKCFECNKVFTSHSHLEKHIEEEHVPEYIKCNKCEMHFRTKWRLMKHHKIHDENLKLRRCHYFNSGKKCPFENLGCKFLHEFSEVCNQGRRCRRHMCQFRH